MPKIRLDRWAMDTSDLIDECEELEQQRDEAREKARVFWGTIKLYIRGQRCFTEAQNEARIARALEGAEWLEDSDE